MLDQLHKDDIIVVWKLDRLSRSLKDLLHIMEIIKAKGAGFKSLTEVIDTTSPARVMFMQIVGSFAEFERAIIKERTKAGLSIAKTEGRIGDIYKFCMLDLLTLLAYKYKEQQVVGQFSMIFKVTKCIYVFYVFNEKLHTRLRNSCIIEVRLQ